MIKILGISGSLRRGSINTALLQAMVEAGGDEVSVEVKTLHGIPLYDGDVEEAEGIPAAVSKLAEAMRAVDGVIFSTPEYNNSIPGVMKNAVDWLSRLDDDVFAGKPVALVGASPGGFGTILAQDAWLPVFRTLGVKFWAEGRLLVSKAGGVFDENGKMVDERMKKKVGEFVEGFAKFLV
ncbi:NAD(P)H-dependent oxidoreductase [Phragmitibacter flavus]|uniref:NAD(P)H-dependent oxidoreductase n=1 Tax=Phragmitibacter flavus TaxID=2576071 RepID=A0A5R8KL12_9BACT|nr:NADPH-dependent FMN reductase [Phragmitibacter flavus]TLD72349.1 NAD(P)H-dependent oxidoreductase [Phragmitibacter flavus]